MGLGFAYLHSGQPELSRAAFAEAIRVDPSRRDQLAALAEERKQ
jgi:cytochrome c-type biogenesis protein CcmH/NrfG